MAKLPGCIADLTTEQYDQLVGWLTLGKSDSEIATLLIDSKWVKVSHDAARKAVVRWRKGTAQNAVVTGIAQRLVTPQGNVRRQIDVLEEMSDLIVHQKRRIARMTKKEDELPEGLLLENLSHEMIRLLSMLEKLGKVQMESGILRRVRVGQIIDDYEPPKEEEEEFVWTEEMEQKMRMLEALFAPPKKTQVITRQ